MLIGNKQFDTKGHTYVMGILNVTPDSFSDGGTHNTLDAALFHADKMMAEGVDIIDVGGESTRPGYTMISDEEEIERILPVIEALKQRFDIPVSVDTYKSAVADAVLKVGADLLNDIWGLLWDEKMADVIADAGCACCLMHNCNAPYSGFEAMTRGMQEDMKKTLELAKSAGIREDLIILDPGIGFGKTYEQNLYLLKDYSGCIPAGYPVLVGASRKSVVGLTLDLPAAERVEGTLVTTVMAAIQGAMFVRVHDVKENVRALRMAEAILGCDR